MLCAVKKIRNAHKDAYKDTPKARIPPVPYVPRPSLLCNVCNVFLCIQKDQNCWRDFHTKVVLEIDLLLGIFHQSFPPFSMLLLAFKLRIAISET